MSFIEIKKEDQPSKKAASAAALTFHVTVTSGATKNMTEETTIEVKFENAAGNKPSLESLICLTPIAIGHAMQDEKIQKARIMQAARTIASNSEAVIKYDFRITDIDITGYNKKPEDEPENGKPQDWYLIWRNGENELERTIIQAEEPDIAVYRAFFHAGIRHINAAKNSIRLIRKMRSYRPVAIGRSEKDCERMVIQLFRLTGAIMAAPEGQVNNGHA